MVGFCWIHVNAHYSSLGGYETGVYLSLRNRGLGKFGVFMWVRLENHSVHIEYASGGTWFFFLGFGLFYGVTTAIMSSLPILFLSLLTQLNVILFSPLPPFCSHSAGAHVALQR